MREKQAGFTLMEMIVTMVVAGILVSIGIPSFISTVRNNRLAAQTNELISSLLYARSEAIKRNARVVVCRSTDVSTVNATTAPSCATGGTTGWETGWLIFLDADNSATFNPPAYPACSAGTDCLLTIHEPLTGGVTLVGNNNVANRVTYGTLGLATGSNGALILKYADDAANANTRVVCIATSGRARLMPKGTSTASCTASN